MHTAMRFTIRSIAATLAFALLLNQFAYAGAPQDATAQATQTNPAPIQPPAPPPNAPVPTQIAAAHNIFVANLGADDNFPIDPTQAYTNVYTALQSWGHYTLVSSPAQADLVFQLRGIAPITNVTGGRGGVYSLTSPAFQLTIVDPKSNIALWTITSPVTITGNNQTKARWVNLATTNLVSRIKVIAGQPLTSEETANLTTFPKSHGLAVALIVLGVGAGLGIGTYLLYRHSVNDQKSSQDAFCTAHGIPLNDCAGG